MVPTLLNLTTRLAVLQAIKINHWIFLQRVLDGTIAVAIPLDHDFIDDMLYTITRYRSVQCFQVLIDYLSAVITSDYMPITEFAVLWYYQVRFAKCSYSNSLLHIYYDRYPDTILLMVDIDDPEFVIMVATGLGLLVRSTISKHVQLIRAWLVRKERDRLAHEERDRLARQFREDNLTNQERIAVAMDLHRVDAGILWNSILCEPTRYDYRFCGNSFTSSADFLASCYRLEYYDAKYRKRLRRDYYKQRRLQWRDRGDIPHVYHYHHYSSHRKVIRYQHGIAHRYQRS